MSTDQELFEMEKTLDSPKCQHYYKDVSEGSAHDYTIAPINIEGRLNTMHFKKGWKRRFIVREMDGILHISLSNNGLVFVQALYMIKERKLYGISGVFQPHWASIKRIFKEEFENIEIIGHVL